MRVVPRSRRTGADFTPSQAAWMKSRRRERCRKRRNVFRQVRIKKTNESEPLMTCRKTLRDVKTGTETLSREAGGGLPVYGSTGVRHEGGVIVSQAWVRNVGTCRPGAKGAAPAGSPRKRHSIEAGHRGGATHSRNEGSVMEPDRRGGGVRCYRAGNSHEEDSHG